MEEDFLFINSRIKDMNYSLNFESPAREWWFWGQVLIMILVAFLVVIFWIKYRTSSYESQKDLFMGFTLFTASALVAQVLYIFTLIRSISGQPDLLFQYIDVGGDGYIFVLILSLSFGFTNLIKPIEKHVLQKDPQIIFRINVVGFFLCLIPYIGAIVYYKPPMDVYWTYLAYPGIVIGGIGLILAIFGSFTFYLRIAWKSSGVLKKKGNLMAWGLILIYFGIFGGSEINTSIGGWWSIINPLTIIIGTIMILEAQREEL